MKARACELFKLPDDESTRYTAKDFSYFLCVDIYITLSRRLYPLYSYLSLYDCSITELEYDKRYKSAFLKMDISIDDAYLRTQDFVSIEVKQANGKWPSDEQPAFPELED